jgi:hypothetical protein
MKVDRRSLRPFFQHHEAAEASLDLTGIWTNELGSIMTINATGATFSGTYQSAVSGAGQSVTGALTGVLAGDAVGFLVDWSPLNSMTAWSGLVLADGSGSPFLYTLWNLAVTPAEFGDYWQAINAGADLFAPIPTIPT